MLPRNPTSRVIFSVLAATCLAGVIGAVWAVASRSEQPTTAQPVASIAGAEDSATASDVSSQPIAIVDDYEVSDGIAAEPSTAEDVAINSQTDVVTIPTTAKASANKPSEKGSADNSAASDSAFTDSAFVDSSSNRSAVTETSTSTTKETSVEKSSGAKSTTNSAVRAKTTQTPTTKAPTTTKRPTTKAVATTKRPKSQVPTTTKKTTTTKAPTTKRPTTTAPTTAPPTTKPPTTKAATTTKPPTTTPQPSGGPTPLGHSGNWTLQFSDEFNGSRLDASKWESAWFSDSTFTRPVNDRESACYHPKQVSVSGGNLKLAASTETNPACQKKDGSRANHVGSLINSRKTFNFTYGYSEARIYLPGDSQGLENWPAFWTTGQDWPRTGEIDILEGLAERKPCFTYHWGSRSNHRHKKYCPPLASPSGWHTFAAKWEPGKITVYYDGVEVWTQTEAVTSSPHYLIVNHGLRDSFGIDTPSTMLVDYVRVWHLPSD